MMDKIDLIMAFEDGTLTDKQIIDLFAMPIKDGSAWTLQGSYGRMATQLIKAVYIDKHGNIIIYRQTKLGE